jgi:hypothetical protein
MIPKGRFGKEQMTLTAWPFVDQFRASSDTMIADGVGSGGKEATTTTMRKGLEPCMAFATARALALGPGIGSLSAIST